MQTNRNELENKIKGDSEQRNFRRLDAFNCHHQRQHKKKKTATENCLFFHFYTTFFLGKFMACDTTFYFTQNTQIQINAKQGINYWKTEENFFCWSNRFVFFPSSASKLIFGQWVPTQKIKFTSINNKKISLSTFVAQQSVVLLILDIDLRPSLLTTFLRTFSAWKPLLAGQHSLLNAQPKQWTDL